MMFLSFQLVNTETKYNITKQECLVVVCEFVKVCWLMIENSYLVLLYMNHQALNFILTKKSNEHVTSQE